MWRRVRVLAPLVCALVIVGVGAVAASADDLTWASPVLIDPPNQHGVAEEVTSLSCPSATLCVGLDNSGNMLTSTDPGGGPSAWTSTPFGASWAGISCPSTTLCVAVAGGDVFTSTDPTDPSSWTFAKVPGVLQFTSISCASATLCVADDNNASQIVTSTNPTAGAGAWQVVTEPGAHLYYLSCTATPSVLCVIPGDGGVRTSTDPTAGVGAWTFTSLGSDAFGQVSCPTANLCVGGPIGPTQTVAETGTIVTSTDPTGGAAAWTPAAIDTQEGYIEGVTCNSPTHCVAYDLEGFALSSDDPAGGASAWSSDGAILPSSQRGVLTMACAPNSLCVAFDGTGDLAVGSPPPTHALSVSLGGDGNGSVTGGGIACPATCTASVQSGTSVTLTAVPDTGEQFTGWSGACNGNGPCTVTMDADQNVAANFAPLPTPPAVTVVPPTIPSPTPSPLPEAPIPHQAPLAPPAPRLARLKVHGSRATVTFARSSATLECALVRQGARAARPAFARCGQTKTFSDLRRGRYTIYARTLTSGGATSAATKRAFTIR